MVSKCACFNFLLSLKTLIRPHMCRSTSQVFLSSSAVRSIVPAAYSSHKKDDATKGKHSYYQALVFNNKKRLDSSCLNRLRYLNMKININEIFISPKLIHRI